MKLFVAILAFLIGLPAVASQIKMLAVGDVMTMTKDAYGEYDVVCANGNSEHVTEIDIKIGNVCPNVNQARATGIEKVERRTDGAFDVTCRDGSITIADAKQIQDGGLCKYLGTIENGKYQAVSGQTAYYDQQLTFVYNGPVLTEAHLVLDNGYKVDFTCQDNECTGTATNGGNAQLRVLGPMTYEFVDSAVGTWGTFEKISQ